MSTRYSSLIVLAVTVCFGAAGLAQAAIKGPYAPDADTVYLFHLNEPAGSTSSASAVAGQNSVIPVDGSTAVDPWPVDTTILGATSFSGFGNAAQVPNTGGGVAFDGNGNGEFNPELSADEPSPDAIDHAFVGPNGAFTVEAMFLLPAGEMIGDGAPREFLSTDSTQSPRGFQFRINPAGALGFRMIGDYPEQLNTPISSITGFHAFENDTWFHAAYTYDGEGTGKFYWTKVDSSVTEANLVATVTTFPTQGGNIPDITTSTMGPLVIGGENRGTTQASFGGLLDEVRISSVERGPGDFIFGDAPPLVPGDFDGDGDVDGADFVVWQTNFPTQEGATLATGDADGDGDVDGADFVVWQTNFPFTPSTSSAGVAPIPEPASVWLLFAGGAVVAVIVRRRQLAGL